MRQMMRRILVACVTLCAAVSASEACVDVQQSGSISLQGTLRFQIFAGPPNFEDVRKGDAPEPAYILQLDTPICVIGDDGADPNVRFDTVQILLSEPASGPPSSNALSRLIGRPVLVEGRSAFLAHTAHHHAPLLLSVSRVTLATDPTASYGTAMTTVRGFYLALGAGDGNAASSFVISQKRSSGPFSAAAITNFYRSLIEPLTILDISAIAADQYRVMYTFVGSDKKRLQW